MSFPLAIARLRTFRALRHPNYRLFAGGQVVSLIGTWMQRIGTAWLVYRLTGSALLLGVIGFCGQVPNFVLGPIAGMAADRFDRYKILLYMQVLQMIQAFVLWGLVAAGVIRFWELVALSLILGAISAFEIPARQAFVVRLVEDKTDLGNAIALNSTMVNGARLIGPSIAGVLVGTFGEAPVFLINALSFLAVIYALMIMKLPPRPPARPRGGAGAHMTEGFRYAFGTPAIRTVLLNLSLLGLVGMPYVVLIPIIAGGVFHGGAHALGFMMGASGFGALIGGIWLAGRSGVQGLNRIVSIANAVFGLALIGTGLSQHFWLTLILMFIAGLTGILQVAGSNTILQAVVHEDQRGRVMSYFAMAFLGITPFGSLAAGWIADHIHAQPTLVICGACCVAAALAMGRQFWRIEIPEGFSAGPASVSH